LIRKISLISVNTDLGLKVLYTSEPPDNPLVLPKSAQSVQDVGRHRQESEGQEHLHVGLVGDALELEIHVLAQIREDVGCEDEAHDERNEQELEIPTWSHSYFEFLKRLSIWGSPPWLTMKITDWEMAENSMITVLMNDFWNSLSALSYLSA
jgi:hypothetical protein